MSKFQNNQIQKVLKNFHPEQDYIIINPATRLDGHKIADVLGSDHPLAQYTYAIRSSEREKEMNMLETTFKTFGIKADLS